MGLDYTNSIIQAHMFEGHFGLEKESLRVTPEGYLAHTRHPFGDDPKMDRDFCESQVELITGVCDSVDEVCEEMKNLHEQAVRVMLHKEDGKEYIWPFSNPPYIKNEEDIAIAQFSGADEWKVKYRNYLSDKYGRRKMAYSGIHYNFSFSVSVLEEAFKKSCYSNYKDFRNALYLELAGKLKRRAWFLVYLTAASPIFDGSFFADDQIGKTVDKGYSSPRCSEIGYWNDFVPTLCYKTLGNYIQGIQHYVNIGKLYSPAEIYCPVRLKPNGKNSLDTLRTQGVGHIEVRVFDLNPLSPYGIIKEDMEFVHLFLIYLSAIEAEEFTEERQILAVKNEKQSAINKDVMIEYDDGSQKPIREAAMEIIYDMERFFKPYDKPEVLEILYYQAHKVMCPSDQYCVKVKQQYGRNYVRKGMELVKSYAKKIDQQ